MKIGEIKVEALKLMFANYAFDMGIDDLQNMTSDENYGSYIVNMNGSISRAIDRIQNACAVPPKAHHIRDDELMAGGYFNRFDTATIADLYVIDRLIAESVSGYDGNAEYHLEGTKIVLKGGAAYTLLYFPVLKAIDGSASDYIDLKDMGIPDHIARLIPLFIKGDLYQEEEPSLAADARNTFEMSLDDLKQNTVSRQNRVRRVLWA